MTVPHFLSTSHRYLSVQGVITVADIITNFRSEVIDNGSPAWTEPVTNTFVSPVDDDGRFFKLVMSVIISTQFECHMFNDSGEQIGAYRINISGSGTEIRIYTGEAHAFIEGVDATPEVLGCGLLDLSPRPQTYHQNYVYAFGYRATNGGVTSYPEADAFCVKDNGTAAEIRRAIGEVAIGAAAPMLDASGFTIHRPVTLCANMSGVTRRIGRLFQAYMVDSSLAHGAELEIPINDNPLATATFKVLGRPTSQTGGFRIAARKT
jgi:hypothetical protein